MVSAVSVWRSCLALAAGGIAEVDVVLTSLACESVVAGFVVDAFAAGVFLASGFAGVEVAEESCFAPEAGACCVGELEACCSLLSRSCRARAVDKNIAPAARMAATPYIKRDGLRKVGFCIWIFWHSEDTRANE